MEIGRTWLDTLGYPCSPQQQLSSRDREHQGGRSTGRIEVKLSLAQPILNLIGILLSTLNSVSAWNFAPRTHFHLHTGVTLNGLLSHREKKKANYQLDTSNIFSRTLMETEPQMERSLAKLPLPPRGCCQ